MREINNFRSEIGPIFAFLITLNRAAGWKFQPHFFTVPSLTAAVSLPPIQGTLLLHARISGPCVVFALRLSPAVPLEQFNDQAILKRGDYLWH
jgi:hypothetical protein